VTELNQDPTESSVPASVAASLSIGESLRRARQARDETVGEVANALKLTQRQVEAMENDRFELLPGAAFARGFLRNYARHLNLDLDAEIANVRFEGEETSNKLTPIANAAGVMPDSEGASRTFAFMKFCVIVLVLIFLLGWYFDWFKVAESEPARIDTPATAERAETAVAPPPRVAPMTVAPVVSSQPGAVAAPVSPADSAMAENAVPVFRQAPPIISLLPEDGAEPPAPASETSAAAAVTTESNIGTAATEVQSGQLVFTLRNSSWIQVRDRDGATLFSGTDTAGTTRKVQGTPPFSLVVGNAPDVTLEFNGRTIDMTANTHSGVARLTVQ